MNTICTPWFFNTHLCIVHITAFLIIQAIWQHKHKVFWFGLIIAEMKANTKEDNL